MPFVNRERELADLADLWERPRPQLIIVYGRRRTGKTTLLAHFVRTRPHLFWVAERTTKDILLRSFSRALWQVEHGAQPASPDFTYPDWEMALLRLADLAARSRLAVVLDEFPYAVEAEPRLPSLLQRLWDHHFKDTQIFLMLCGSHVGMMEETTLRSRAPLFGRRTGQILLKPLAFDAIRQFFPTYSAIQQVTIYAILNGVPAYLEQFDPRLPVAENVRQQILRTTAFLYAEPQFLLSDEVREPRNYLAIIRAVALGHRRPSAIAQAAGMPASHVSRYLATLQALHLVERQVPATEEHPERSRQGRYRLQDHYLQFYYRFVAPHLPELEQGQVDRVWAAIEPQLEAYVGPVGFEPLCRDWVRRQGWAGDLPFVPERVGAHWDAERQIDVVAINRTQRALLVGEAKWTGRPVGVEVLSGLQARTQAIVPDATWAVHYVLFARSGFSQALQEQATQRPDLRLVTLGDLVV